MLDAYIIDQMNREEKARQNRSERPVLRLPLEPFQPGFEEELGGPEYGEDCRGVIVIDLLED